MVLQGVQDSLENLNSYAGWLAGWQAGWLAGRLHSICAYYTCSKWIWEHLRLLYVFQMDVEHLRLLYVFQSDLGAFALTIRVPNGFRLKKLEKVLFW